MTTARILIVDDDRELCEELADILSGEGHAVTTALDGVAGLALARELRFDILLLDLRLPGIGGLEILRAVAPVRGNRVVLVISGSPLDSNLPKPDDEEDASAEILRLADRLIPKPFNVVELLETIRELSPR